jgi:UDP-N-acetylglucosamine 2-epimerase (non-hydrolysing)
MDVGTLIMSGLRSQRVLEAVQIVINHHQTNPRTFKTVSDYETGPVSKQVLRIVLSYVDYVNRTVWHKTSVPS